MYDFLFYDYASGEEFFVECDNVADAWDIVADNFDVGRVKYEGRFSVEEAEAIGLDTY